MTTSSGISTLEFTTDEHPKVRNLALDGIRAFSVAAVLAFHGGLAHAHGGFLGVDVFFALSGFLITSLLVSEIREAGGINLGRFWLRRAKRLFPALWLMLIATTLGAAVLTAPGLYSSLRSDVVATFFYFANWHLVAQPNSYFAMLFPPTPLTHTWSLAIEEQFYIVWPLVVLVVYKWRRSTATLGWLAVGMAAASTALMAYGEASTWTVNRLYYGTDTHAQGLLCGAAAACALATIRSTSYGGRWTPERLHGLMKWLGPISAVLLLSLVLHAQGSDRWMFNGGFMAVAILSSLLILYVVALPRTSLARFLSIRPFVYIGEISYGIYLWHYPVFHWLTGNQTGLGVWPLFAVRVAVTLVVSALSFRFVEAPIRRSSWPQHRRHLAVGAAVALLVLGSSMWFADRSNTYPFSKAPAPTKVARPMGVALLGDSMMWTLAYGEGLWGPLGARQFGLAEWAPHYGATVSTQATIGCGIIPAKFAKIHSFPVVRIPICVPRRNGTFPAQRLWQIGVNHPGTNVVVVLAGVWETRLLLIEHHWRSILDPSMQRLERQSLDLIASYARTAHTHVVFMTMPCTWSGEKQNGRQWPEDSARRRDIYNSILRQEARKVGASVFDLNSLVCPGGTVHYFIDGLYVRTADGVHFAPQAAEFLSPTLFPFLRKVVAQPLPR